MCRTFTTENICLHTETLCGKMITGKNTNHQGGAEMNAKAKETIKNIAESTTSRIKVAQLCEAIYRELEKAGIRRAIVNDRGIDIEGEERDWFDSGTVWFQRDNGNDCWKAFQVVDCKNAAL